MKDIYITGEPIDITAEKSFSVQISMTPEEHAIWIGFCQAPQPKQTWGDCQVCNDYSMILAIQNNRAVCPSCWEVK